MNLHPYYMPFVWGLALFILVVLALVRVSKLVGMSPPQPAPSSPDTEPVVVYETGDPALVPVALSLLQDADIPFFTSGESTQHLIGGGQFGGRNLATGPVRFLVRRQDLDSAREVLRDLATEGAPREENDRSGA